MKKLYAVTYEWLLKGEGETYQAETINVVADDAPTAVKAAIAHCRRTGSLSKGEAFADVRLAQVIKGEGVDLIA